MGAAFGASMTKLLRRLDECLIPDDRDKIVDLLVAIERKLVLFSGATVISQRFYNCGGVTLVLNIMKKMMKDEVVLR